VPKTRNHLIGLALSLPIVATGCALIPQADAVSEFVKIEGARAYDEGLVNSEWFICRAASVGAVRRRYATSADKAEAWRALCLGDPEAPDLITPTRERNEGQARGPGTPLPVEP